MVDLHDSYGKHIANFVNGQLYDIHGRNIGRYLPDKGIFIDMHGCYLGEIVDGKRLLYKNNSPYKSICYGSYGNCGDIGSYGNYGNIGSCFYAGYLDVKI